MKGAVEDYCHLRGMGVSNREIARRRGIEWESLRRWASRNRCWIPEADERRAVQRLAALRDSGQPFQASQIAAANPLMVFGLISAEVKAGRLQRVTVGRPELVGVAA